jgi:hypothetical protein
MFLPLALASAGLIWPSIMGILVVRQFLSAQIGRRWRCASARSAHSILFILVAYFVMSALGIAADGVVAR